MGQIPRSIERISSKFKQMQINGRVLEKFWNFGQVTE